MTDASADYDVSAETAKKAGTGARQVGLIQLAGSTYLARLLLTIADDPDQIKGLRRALLAFINGPNSQAQRAGLLQLAAELEKIEKSGI
jgi:hypothetical protein